VTQSEVKTILSRPRVIVVGAGIGGLTAAIGLATRGCDVTLLEREAAPGGKMRQLTVDGRAIDAGPTVFTMRWVFEQVFAEAGARLDEHVRLSPASILARHAWSADQRLDLFADIDRSEAAIAAFAGPAEARGFRAFCRAASRAYATLEGPFIKSALPSMLGLAAAVGNPVNLLSIRPFATLWSELGNHMRDPRLRQLFGRYATYCGSSPFLAPATLMLVADVEQQGVWFIDGGMHALARALADLATARGVDLRYGAEVAEITASNRISGVRLASGETLAADAVVVNADPQAVATGRLGRDISRAIPRRDHAERSLSALTWTGLARATGFPLQHHTVFFSSDYKAEFDQLARGSVPTEPTVYVCAQDRDDRECEPDGLERLLILINAPPTGDTHAFTETEIDKCRQRAFRLMQRCGLTLTEITLKATSPTAFDRLFPGTGGALYGPAVHGSTASFKRPGSRTAIKGLYLAGGATHPGAGVPMAALSGRLAASALMADLASTPPSRATAMSGGMSTR